MSYECPHCGARSANDVEPHKTWEYAGETAALRACAACAGRFSNPLPSSDLLARLYGADFNYGWYRDHYPAKLLDALIRVLQYRRMGLLAGKRVLDYGGGLGYFSRAARLLGYDARTEDPAMSGGAASGEWDAVICHHALEHAPRPEDMLATMAGLLAPSGKLIVAVPNAGSLGYEKVGMDFVWAQPPFVHIHHFTARGLRALLERHGWIVDAVHFFERWDANTFADVQHARRFAVWDGRWSAARWKWGMAQLNSALRFLALLGTPVVARVPEERRPELLVVARRPSG